MKQTHRAGNRITLHAAKQLRRGTVLYSRLTFGSDGRPLRWVVNGKVKTWKRDPSRVLVPLKHGLWSYDYLDEFTLETLSLDEVPI